jgi:hypothetical protein
MELSVVCVCMGMADAREWRETVCVQGEVRVDQGQGEEACVLRFVPSCVCMDTKGPGVGRHVRWAGSVNDRATVQALQQESATSA